MKHNERPLEMLERQLAANRAAIKFRHPKTKKRHFCHLKEYRSAFINDVILLRAAIRKMAKEKQSATD